MLQIAREIVIKTQDFVTIFFKPVAESAFNSQIAQFGVIMNYVINSWLQFCF